MDKKNVQITITVLRFNIHIYNQQRSNNSFILHLCSLYYLFGNCMLCYNQPTFKI